MYANFQRAMLRVVLAMAAGMLAIAPASPASAANCGEVLIAADEWMNGHGIDVRSNGVNMNTGTGCANNDTEVYNLSASPPIYGFGWQCVELVNRLYKTKGWFDKLTIPATYNGQTTNFGAKWLYTLAADGYYNGLTAYANGSNYTPVQGDMIVHSNGTHGHVAVVDSVQGSTLYAVDQNRSGSGWETYTWNADTHAASMSGVTISGFVHASGNSGFNGGRDSMPTPPYLRTASTEDAQYGGDFNGDGWGDTVFLHQIANGGMHIHILFGGIGNAMFTQELTFVRELSGADGWDWAKIKVVAGRFNNDQYADLALLHKIPDGGFDVHVLFGGAGANMFSSNYASFYRRLSGADGWNWDPMKVVSGNFNGDQWDDIAIVHALVTGNTDVHLLYGQQGANMFSAIYPSFTRRLYGSAGWVWNQMKLAAGDFNGDRYADLAIFHLRTSDNWIDIHILYGGGGYTFVNSVTIVRNLAGSGWDWNKVKLVAGDFNGGPPADVALLHQLPDGGFDVHIMYGDLAGTGNMFMNNSTFLRHMYGAAGWNWSQLKLTSGDFNFDGTNYWGDITMLHQISDGGFDVHVLYGEPSGVFVNSATFVRRMYGTWGWDWSKIKVG